MCVQGQSIRPGSGNLVWEELSGRTLRAFQTTGYPSLRRLRIEVRSGCIFLRGCVPSYFLKQMAQSAAMSVSGVSRVVNQIEVR